MPAKIRVIDFSDQEIAEEPEDRTNGAQPHRRLLKATPMTEVRWLWDQHIPLGHVTILDGDPGQGKSMLALSIAAAVTRAGEMPDGTDCGVDAGQVLLMADEDDAGSTIRPRLETIGAKTDNIFLADKPGPDLLIIPQDLDLVQQQAKGCRLIIIDPADAYVGSKYNPNSAQDARFIMSELRRIAEEEDLAVLLVRHQSKGTRGGKAIDRGSGSLGGWNGSARSVMSVWPEPGHERHKLLTCTKTNLGENWPSLRYEVKGLEGIGYIEWLGVAEISSDQASEGKAAKREHRPSPREKCREAILDALKDGEKMGGWLRTTISDRFPVATYNRARKELIDEEVIEKLYQDGAVVWRIIDSD